MADKSIFDLTLQSTFGVNDRLVVGNYANNDAEAILGQTLINLLTTALDGHGGIQSIAKTSSTGTNPVVDTYTITYADASTSTFTITNGLKGDTGAQTYVYLRWAHECTGTPPVPSSWSSTTSEPDDWIGIGTGTSSSPPTNVNSYKWYKYKGETGATGTAATITTQTVRYQASTSGTVVPSGTWSSTIPTVPQGSYLWTRTELAFNDGTTVTSYSVGRMGIDGSGAVSTVNNIGVDSGTTNITLTGGDIPIDSTPSANVAVVTDGSGKFAPASVSATELNMLSGANSNIQTQLNAKASSSSVSNCLSLAQYQSGDTINLAQMIFAGHLTSGSKSINFFIPLPKDMSNITSASLSVDTSWNIRHSDGGYIITGSPLASFATPHFAICSTGVLVYADASTALSVTNNTPIVVHVSTATLKLI